MIEILAKAIHHTMEFGDFDIYIVQDEHHCEHVVLTKGDVVGERDLLCRVSSECLPGTALFSAECDCKQEIEYSLKLIENEGRGIFIYLRQEGRGHGLAVKINALANKNKGMDTFEAVECMGLPADIREYAVVKEIIDYFCIESIRCICNNPDKLQLLRNEGIVINSMINIPVKATPYSLQHLHAKQKRGHKIQILD